MGLDMFLKKHTFLGLNYEHRRVELAERGMSLPDLSAFGIDINKVSEVVEQTGYWRKANAVHGWFVQNIQNGNDDCKSYEVGRKQFEALLEDVNTELEIKGGNDELGTAGEFLPPAAGFFFGSQALDEWYYKDLQYTKELIEGILKDWDNLDGWYTYQSSW